MMRETIMFVMIAIVLIGCGREQHFKSGRDTVKSFGDGRYQVLRLPNDDQVLYDVQAQSEILRSPLAWEQSRRYVVFIGYKGSEEVRIQIDLNDNQIEELKMKDSQQDH